MIPSGVDNRLHSFLLSLGFKVTNTRWYVTYSLPTSEKDTTIELSIFVPNQHVTVEIRCLGENGYTICLAYKYYYENEEQLLFLITSSNRVKHLIKDTLVMPASH